VDLGRLFENSVAGQFSKPSGRLGGGSRNAESPVFMRLFPSSPFFAGSNFVLFQRYVLIEIRGRSDQ
jgi:hypothetical protein